MSATTKTKAPTTVAAAERELELARQAHADLRASVAAGEPGVGPGKLAEAAAAIDFAELVLEAARTAETQRTTDAQQARIDELVADMRNVERLRTIVSAAGRAREALAELITELLEHRQTMTRAAAELMRMSRAGVSMPAGVFVTGLAGMPNVRLDGVTVTDELRDGVVRDVAVAPVLAAAEAAGLMDIVNAVSRLQTTGGLAHIERRLERLDGAGS